MFRPLMYLHPPAIRDAKMRSNIFLPIFSIYANFWLCFSGLTCTKYKISRSCTNIVHNIWLQILESRQKRGRHLQNIFQSKLSATDIFSFLCRNTTASCRVMKYSWKCMEIQQEDTQSPKLGCSKMSNCLLICMFKIICCINLRHN